MKDPVTVALITSIISLVVALVSGGISVWNRSRTDRNANELQVLKGDIDKDLEKLRATLSHGQSVSATQWNAEFAAYQAIWAAIVEVRPIADKLVNREIELHQFGLPQEYLANEERLKYRKDLTQKLVSASQGLLSAIHNNAPFYPALIRQAANEAHSVAFELIKKNLGAMTQVLLGTNIIQNEDFHSECETILLQLVQKTDEVESLIRDRLAAVQVFHSAVL